MPCITRFPLDGKIIARTVYRSQPHPVMPVGLVVEESVRCELEHFLERFLRHAGTNEEMHLRVDAFPRDDSLDIIEINVECREGWGIALNLLRAGGHPLTADDSEYLPSRFIRYSDDYLPEFELARTEAALLGRTISILPYAHGSGPATGSDLNDKRHLARFSRLWAGEKIRVPPMYAEEWVRWHEIPEHVVFKFCEKYGRSSARAKYSVAPREAIGKGRFVRRCYCAGEVIAQHRMGRSLLEDDSAVQAIFMCTAKKGCVKAVAGYLQIAPPGTFIINDRTAKKGPLVFTR